MQRIKLVLKYIYALFFVVAGVNHFIKTAFYVRIVPPYLPLPLLLVYVSGLCEIVLGVLLLTRRFRRVAAWGLIALLVAVSPANIQMAFNHELYREYSVTALWLRLPLQVLLMAWAYLYTLPVVRGGERRAEGS